MLYLDSDSGLITITRQQTLYLSRRIDMGYQVLGTDVNTAAARLDRIVVEIQRSLDYYESHFSQPPVTNVVITPLPERIAGFDEYLGRQLGISARLLDLNTLIDVETPLEQELQSHCVLAIGAALREESKEL
jgi:MSHA biogenesis protein MshI